MIDRMQYADIILFNIYFGGRRHTEMTKVRMILSSIKRIMVIGDASIMAALK